MSQGQHGFVELDFTIIRKDQIYLSMYFSQSRYKECDVLCCLLA